MNLIEIRPPATFDEYQQACSLVHTVYQEHGIAPQHRLAHPKANFVAVQDGQVLGTVGFRSGAQGSLPAEYFFGFDVEQVCSCPRAAVFEIVKLAARERADLAVFRGLIAACARYAFEENGFQAGLAIVKPNLERAINRLLHIPSSAPECQIVRARAMAENPLYFFEDVSPRPIRFAREDYRFYGRILLEQVQPRGTVSTYSFDHHRDYSVPASYPTPCWDAAVVAA